MWFTPTEKNKDPVESKWMRQPSQAQEDDDVPKGPRGTQFVWHCNILDRVVVRKDKRLRKDDVKKYKYCSRNALLAIGHRKDS